MSEDLVARVRLIRSTSIGPVTFRQLLSRFGSAQAALAAIPDLAARGGGKPPAIAPEPVARKEIDRVEALGARYLTLGQGLYPRLLAELADAPPLLIAKGISGCSTGRSGDRRRSQCFGGRLTLCSRTGA